MGGPYATFEARHESTTPDKQFAHAAKNAFPNDSKLQGLVATASTATGLRRQAALETLRSYIDAKAGAESLGNDPLAIQQALQIKKSPLYRDERLESSNWFAKAGNALWNALSNLFKFDVPKTKLPNVAIPSILGTWMIYIMWAVLAGLLILLGYVALKHARWRKNLRRKASALLEEDEPERSLDEWLERANALELQGKYREAVRCLYLACLLKFDEARVARFDRGQTNWEHLTRIQGSPQRPAGLDFEPATKAFDQIWYGMRTKGKADIDSFRGWYLYVSQALTKRAA